MPAPPQPNDQPHRYAVHMEPQLQQTGQAWTATYPGAQWSVSAPSRAQALHRLGEEVTRRQNDGEDVFAYTTSILQRHLREPIPGVYAVDNELYRELIHAPEAERQRVLDEAERRRRVGLTYTRDDYLNEGRGTHPH